MLASEDILAGPVLAKKNPRKDRLETSAALHVSRHGFAKDRFGGS